MTPFSDTAPATWARTRLRFCIQDRQNGAWGQEPGADEKDVVCIRVADFDWDRLTIDLQKQTMRSIPSDHFAKLALRKGDILIEKSGGGEKTPVGRVVRFEEDIEAITSNFVARLRPAKSVQPRFLSYVLAALYLSKYSHQFIKQNTGIQNLDDAALLSTSVYLPDYDAQKAIATFLDRETARIDKLIEKKQAMVRLMAENKRSLATALVTRSTNPDAEMSPTGMDCLSEAPSHWRIRRIASLYSEADEMGEEGLPVLSVSINWGISDRELVDEDRHRMVNHIEDKASYKRVRPGDLVYNMMRAWQGAFGVTLIDGLVSPAYVVARPKEDIHSAYFESLLRTPMWIEEFRRASKGIADFRQRLYWEHFRQVRVVLPPYDEQVAIAGKIRDASRRFDNLLAPIEASIDRLREFRASLITATVTGKIEVSEWQKRGSAARRLETVAGKVKA